jgi:hypothetical protein
MARQTKNYVCAVFSGGFTSFLRNGWIVNLRVIENCIFSTRSIERNMRHILWTVYVHIPQARTAFSNILSLQLL